MEVKGQQAGVGSVLLPCGVTPLGVELRLMQQAALSPELSHWPLKDVLKSLGSKQQLKLIKHVVVLERLVYQGGGRSLFLILADPGEIRQSLILCSCSQ